MREKFIDLAPEILHEAVLLNRSLLKQPFQREDLALDLSYNLWEFYQTAIQGEVIPLEAKPSVYRIDRTSVIWSTWDDWYREVIWYGNKKGAYLYGHSAVEPQIAGHF